jgi:hypothetical protein
MTTKQKIKLSEEILNDKDKVAFIYEFLEETNIWHNLCRKSILNLNVFIEDKPFNKDSEFYPYEKLTFTFLLYYNFEGRKLLEISNIFIKSTSLYTKMLKKHGLIKNKSESLEDFKLRILIESIFATIAKDKDTWVKVKDHYKNFCLRKELNHNLSDNYLEKKKIKI